MYNIATFCKFIRGWQAFKMLRDWSKSIGGGGGAFGNVVDKKHMAHPLPSAQK